MKVAPELTACALIPAYNEAARITETIHAVEQLPVSQILVVDDGSTDHTAALAHRAGAEVLTLPRNQGKGAAIQAGLARVTSDLVLLLDADLGSSACLAQELLVPVCSNRCDIAVAVFAVSQQRGGGLGLTIGLARWGVRYLTGQAFHAPLSGQRALRTETLQRLLPLPRDFGFEVGLTLKALRAGYRVEEVLLPLHHRVTGRSARDVWHRGCQFYQVGKALLTCR
ncbi:MAG TPA: glycosyltransferase family 2 protein [Firmicutes bacterium]|nr:glycosyltransferase family 2 protein [Bacillota bacterium]